MIGQEHLINLLNEYTIDTFPRSVMLVGEEGIGKHTLVNYISNNILKLPVIDITEDISDEYISAIYRNPNPNIYLIDLSKMTEKSQNVILKFVEEPLNNSFIIILSESRTGVLNTVLNRCIIFDFEPYTKEQLKSFLSDEIDEDLILSIIRTPGKLKNIKLSTISEIFALAEKMTDKIGAATYPNALSIADKMNFKDEYDKFDLDLFFDIFKYSLFSSYVKSNNTTTYKMYQLTREVRDRFGDKRINKELMFINYLTNLWKLARGEM